MRIQGQNIYVTEKVIKSVNQIKWVNISSKYNLYNTKPSWLNIQHTCLSTINLLQLNLQCTLQEESHTIDLLFIQIDKYEIGTSKNRWLPNGPKWANVNFLNVFYFFKFIVAQIRRCQNSTLIIFQPWGLGGLRRQQCSNIVGSEGPRFKSHLRMFIW